MMDWQNYVTESQNSLRVLAELTGGYAAINQNDFTKALKRIDAETSDYYVIGYYSSNPDPTKKRRRIDVNVTRPNVNVLHRTEYTLKAPPVPRPAPAKITKPTDKDKDKKVGRVGCSSRLSAQSCQLVPKGPGRIAPALFIFALRRGLKPPPYDAQNV